MFGHHKMTHDGTAKVVSCELPPRGLQKTDSQGRSTAKFDLILDVYPEGAPPFRTEVHEWFSPARFPDPGDSFGVRCNPEKQAVEIDLTADTRFNPKLFRSANASERKERHERTLNAPPGTPAAAGSGAIEDPDLAELARLDAEEPGRDGG
jgi:hypothetical protein